MADPVQVAVELGLFDARDVAAMQAGVSALLGENTALLIAHRAGLPTRDLAFAALLVDAVELVGDAVVDLIAPRMVAFHTNSAKAGAAVAAMKMPASASTKGLRKVMMLSS